MQHIRRPPRILFVAPRYHTNQVESVRALKNAGYQVNYLVQYIGPTEDHTELTPVVAPLSSLGRYLVRRACRRMDWMSAMRIRAIPQLRWTWKYIQTVRPDMVVVRGPTQIMGFICTLFARAQGSKVLFYTQQGERAPAIKELLYKALLNLFRATWMTPIRSSSGELHPSVRRIIYVPFVAPPPSKYPIQSSYLVRVLSVGKFVPRKNHLLLVEAMQPWLTSRRANLTLVGEAATEEQFEHLSKVRQKIKELKLDNYVTIRTDVPPQDMSNIYRYADLFVLPSRDEPAAVSLVEAMACGLPAICSSTNGTQCYIQQGENGYIFKSNCMASLREHLTKVIDHPEVLERMKHAAVKSIACNHSARAYVSKITSIMQYMNAIAHN